VNNQGSNIARTAVLRDRLWLLGAGVLVCVVGGAVFLLGEMYHVNPAWLFFGWNSIFLYFVVAPDFRSHLGSRRFLACLLGWMILHGFFVLFLMRRVSIAFWLPLMAVELAIGYVVLGLGLSKGNQRESGA
jgi:FtsH-binding integral membrane protein